MTDKIVIFTTCATEADARRIATHLVEQRLAACVNIMPGATSVYQWKGKVVAEAEFLLIIKSRLDLVASIEQEFRTIHPYDVPELIALSVVGGGAAYLDWLSGELRPTAERD